MQKLSPAQLRELRARAHHLNPVVSVAANGLSESVQKEIDTSLSAHELIKVRVYGDDREARVALMQQICDKLSAAPVQHIGKLLVIFRANPPSEKPAPLLIKRALPPRRIKTIAGKPIARQPGVTRTKKPLAPRRATPKPAAGTTPSAARSGTRTPSRSTAARAGHTGGKKTSKT